MCSRRSRRTRRSSRKLTRRDGQVESAVRLRTNWPGKQPPHACRRCVLGARGRRRVVQRHLSEIAAGLHGVGRAHWRR